MQSISKLSILQIVAAVILRERNVPERKGHAGVSGIIYDKVYWKFCLGIFVCSHDKNLRIWRERPKRVDGFLGGHILKRICDSIPVIIQMQHLSG